MTPQEQAKIDALTTLAKALAAQVAELQRQIHSLDPKGGGGPGEK